jgi:glucosamine-6-phosphate deaminase
MANKTGINTRDRNVTHEIIKAPVLDVRVYDTRLEMGAAAAELVSKKLQLLLDEQEFVNVIFAAAPSQNEFLQLLAVEKNIDWKRVNAFHMDEYLGLASDAPQGFGNFLKERLFSKLPFRSVNYIDGNAGDIQEECRRYSELVLRHRADIVCMGVGENGHIAFNDPPVAHFSDVELVKVVELEQACRQQQVNDKCFDALNQVPLKAITLTIPALMSAKYIYCIVPGKTKAEAVYNTINQEVDEKYPSTIIRRHKNAILFLDRESSALL